MKRRYEQIQIELNISQPTYILIANKECTNINLGSQVILRQGIHTPFSSMVIKYCLYIHKYGKTI